jgi:hypothetical protein
MKGYAHIFYLTFNSENEWNSYLEKCKTVKPDDFGSYLCTEEGINKLTIGKTSKYTITSSFPADSPQDFQQYYNQGEHNYLDTIKENFEEIK